jgi:hypothetical protein
MYFLNDRLLEFDNIVILSFECGPEFFLIKIRIIIGLNLDFALLVLFAFEHLEVELILIFELGLLFE